jgi:hypothetical protein
MGLHGRRLAAVCSGLSTSTSSSSTLRAGIIGLDTADAVAITEALSSSRACRVVAAVRRGTGAAMSTNSTAVNHRIIRSSGDQIFPNTERARATGVVIVVSAAEDSHRGARTPARLTRRLTDTPTPLVLLAGLCRGAPAAG